jgi:tetratricopeptide (TPR) repeat protein
VTNEAKSVVLWCAALLAFAFALYGRYLLSGWVYDDQSLIVHNTRLDGPLTRDALLVDLGDYLLDQHMGYWRPGSLALFWATAHLTGKNPFAWRIVSIVLLAACAGLLLWLLIGVGAPLNLAGAAALLFLAHPVNAEAVGVANQINSSAELLFVLGAILALTRQRPLLCALCFAGALSIRESAVVLPAAVLAYPLLQRRRTAHDFLAPILCALVLGAYLLVRFGALDIPLVTPETEFQMWQRMGLVAYAAARLIVLPLPRFLSIRHGLTPAAPQLIAGWLVIALAAALAVYLAIRARKNPTLVHPAFFFVTALVVAAPYSGLAQPVILFADHYFMLPAVFLFSAAALLFAQVAPDLNRQKQIAAVIAFTLLFGGLGLCTISRARVFRNDAAALGDAAAKYPDAVFSHIYRGDHFFDAGRLPEAQLEYAAAIRLSGGRSRRAYNSLGDLFFRQGDLARAETCFRRAGREGWPNLAVLLFNTRRYDELRPLLTQMLARNPHDAMALRLMASGRISR